MNNTPPAPKFALSIRQPWAWLIAHGFKDVENRSWRTTFRGRFYIHAAKGMTREEYESARDFALHARPVIKFPAFEELERGGIVGAADLTGCVEASTSPWFCGPFGFTLENTEAIPFRPLRGALSFFRVEPLTQPSA